VILAKQFEWLIHRRHTCMDEIIDSRLPRRHANIRSVTLSKHSPGAATATRRLLIWLLPDTESTGEDWMAFKPNYGRDRAERARAARAKSEEKQRKKDEKAALRKAEREGSEPPSDERDPTA
jgi:hypothetical protein